MSRRPSSPGTPLRNGLLVQNPAWNAWLRLRDRMATASASRAADASGEARRVLLGVGGHLGDAVLASSAVAVLRDHVPGVEIGVVSGGWNRVVFDGDARVRWLHQVDHWKLNRAGQSLAARWWRARRTRSLAEGEMHAVGYDVAIDLTPYYPNFARIFRAAGIPTRIGYTTGGGGPHLTHAVAWRAGRHVSQDHLALLRAAWPNIPGDVAMRCELAPAPDSAQERVRALLGAEGIAEGSYVVIHPGAGAPRKEWAPDDWVAVAKHLLASGARVVLTGAGAEQARLTASIAQQASGCVDLCNRVSFAEYRGVISGARLVLSVDTVAMHVAAAAAVPGVALMTAMDDPARWRPLSDKSRVLWQPVECAPCYRSKGCDEMLCVRGITRATVLEAVASLTAL